MIKKCVLKKKQFELALVLVISLLCFAFSFAANRTVNLVVAYKTVNFTSKPVRAIAVNHQIPAPTLHFKIGDHVTINVYNHIDQGMTIHWHGIILPWRMDGVANVTQKPIPPGGVFHYKFTLKQYGTYWYHAHSDLQEQRGLYGAFIIDPPHKFIQSNKDFVVVLSDWINTHPNQVYRNLKKEGEEYYAPYFPIQPSLVRFIHDYNSAKTPKARKKIVNAYKMMQQMRMSIYDVSDIAYDTFLLNGHPPSNPWRAKVKVGDVVRLRFIDAGASTIFNVKIPGQQMKIVSIDGNNIKPYNVKCFSIDPGETYDVLTRIKTKKPTIIYVQSTDKVGVAIGALVTNRHQVVHYKQIKPFPDPAPVTMGHQNMQHGKQDKIGAPKQHKMMMNKMQHTMAQTESVPSLSTKTNYDRVQSPTKTNNPNIPVHVIRIALSGFMNRYIWFINGVPEYKAKPFMIKRGQRYRLIFTNRTMMRHPMHLHGHWMILRNGHGAYDPKMHTIDIPPGATVIADFDADTSGQWYFHCHNLYHMKAGMANIFRYETPPGQTPIKFLAGHKTIGWFFANRLDLSGDFIHHIYQSTLDTLIGSDYNKLQLYSEDAEINQGKVEEFNLDVFYWHLISQFWAVKGGVNYVYRPAKTPYLQPGIGIEGLMPYFIQTDVRAYLHKGSVKLDLQLARDTQITNNFFLRLSIRSIFATKTISDDEIGQGLNDMEYTIRPYYRLTSNLSLYAEYEHKSYYGDLKRIRKSDNEGNEDIFSLGIGLLL